MFYKLCIGHSYLPCEMMKTVVAPIIRDKTGDASDPSNYRPISLATILAKVLDSVLDGHITNNIDIHDAQFGFKAGLSTEAAILSLKHTVKYYTQRETPVYACYLDLSKAFDLVHYDVLWNKLKNESEVPEDVIALLRYWYQNQTNHVRWAGCLSEPYKLECGVRQGGITSSKLFNLYINQLIVELSSTNIGCHIDGVCVNNISYADDMVLLCPTISALRRLLAVCERYAVAHGLGYNAKKSEIMVFKAGPKCYANVPAVNLCGSPLNKVSKFKYLGH